MINIEVQREAEAKLTDARRAWEKRLEAIQADRRRSTPLDTNLNDQAIQRENDDALDGLDARGRGELEAIEAALARLQNGTFGSCVRCGETIDWKRIEAQPTAAMCLACMESDPTK